MTSRLCRTTRATRPESWPKRSCISRDGPLEGLKLIGFAVWERKTGNGRNVTFPARQYSVNGERRSFALLRPIGDSHSAGPGARSDPAGYAEHEAAAAVAP